MAKEPKRRRNNFICYAEKIVKKELIKQMNKEDHDEEYVTILAEMVCHLQKMMEQNEGTLELFLNKHLEVKTPEGWGDSDTLDLTQKMELAIETMKVINEEIDKMDKTVMKAIADLTTVIKNKRKAEKKIKMMKEKKNVEVRAQMNADIAQIAELFANQ